MNTLLKNVITELPLAYFLILAVSVGIVGLLAGVVTIWLCDGTRDDDLSGDVEVSDPYEVAFLQGDAERVSRLVVFDLIERGYVEFSGTRRRFAFFAPSKMWRRSATAPEITLLTPLQRVAWDWLAVPRLPGQIAHRQIGLVNLIRPRCESLLQGLNSRRFLETGRRRLARKLVRFGLSFGLVTLALYKLITAIILGTGGSFVVILLTSLGLLATAIVCRRVRLSDLGQRYLEFLRVEMGDWRVSTDELRTMDATPQAERLMQMALFGEVKSDNVGRHLHEGEFVRS
ncbi:MAG: TIGR04222 domain-containing membrane protein [Planctomycetes bacterium]|nr:TIGR04222 domain-containing membrane protein [Planctomycetota bacterium]